WRRGGEFISGSPSTSGDARPRAPARIALPTPRSPLPELECIQDQLAPAVELGAILLLQGGEIRWHDDIGNVAVIDEGVDHLSDREIRIDGHHSPGCCGR